jgi:hypothetical protein
MQNIFVISNAKTIRDSYRVGAASAFPASDRENLADRILQLNRTIMSSTSFPSTYPLAKGVKFLT